MESPIIKIQTLIYFIGHINAFISRRMGTGAREPASACESNGHVRTCVSNGHDRELAHGRIPILAEYSMHYLCSIKQIRVLALLLNQVPLHRDAD